MKQIPRILLLLVITGALGILAASCASLPAEQPEAVQPTPTVDRLAAPPMPEKPSQADQGRFVYYQVCMACHGDRGQGLTNEWREVWEEDANCWQSNCHGNDPPSWGFSIRRDCCPAVIGPNIMQRFNNGQELFDYISTTMPWWNPGYLKTEEFWQVTNYLMRANGAIPDGITLDAGNAFIFNLHPASPPPEDDHWQALLVCGLLSLIAGLLYIRNRAIP